jgi:hypothetical protein
MHRLPKSFPLFLVFFSSLPAAAQERIQYSPPTTPSSLGLAGYSKVLCSYPDAIPTRPRATAGTS